MWLSTCNYRSQHIIQCLYDGAGLQMVAKIKKYCWGTKIGSYGGRPGFFRLWGRPITVSYNLPGELLCDIIMDHMILQRMFNIMVDHMILPQSSQI